MTQLASLTTVKVLHREVDQDDDCILAFCSLHAASLQKWDVPHIEDEESSEETSSSESSDSSESDSAKELMEEVEEEEEIEEENVMGSVTRVLSPVKFLVGK